MLNEILSEFEKVREKDKSTKKNISDMIKGLKSELKGLESELEENINEMSVRITTNIHT
jgi:hypothetical protein